ncbi:MAG: ribosome-associated translation inhibitor RaiA, partial [Verrucomicrobiales bacterium]
MPDGHLQRADESKNEAIIIRKGRRFVAAMQEVERAACVVGARVHFDIDRRDGVDRATNVRLVSGTRTNKRQRRFGDLTGAKLPGAKVKSTSSSHLGVDVTTQPKRVIDAWLEAMAESRFDDATSLYAPNGVLHTPRATKAGRKTIRATLEDEVSTLLPQGAERSIVGEDLLVHVRFHDGARSVNEWFEVYRGAILEHWHEIAPDLEDESVDGPAITIIRSGEISEAEELRLRDDLQRVAARLHGPVEEIRVKIDTPSTPSHPYSVTGAIHAGTLHVRSHVTAPSFAEAIDALSLRLRRQVERSVSRNRRPPDRHRPDGDSWRHADRPSPDEFTALGPIASSREIVRHKAWGP